MNSNEKSNSGNYTDSNIQLTDNSPDFNFEIDFFTEKTINIEKLKHMDEAKESRANQIKENKIKKRIKTRQKIKEKNHKANEERLLKTSQMTEEEKKLYYLEKEKKKINKDLNNKKGLESEFTIVFDLDYMNLMKTAEIKSVAKQLAQSYFVNKIVKNPILFYLCSYTGEIKKELSYMGADNWLVKINDEKFSEIKEIIESKKEIIYLSPDSENILEEVNNSQIYIIGGFVDKPVSKYRSLYKANSLNIKTSRLPLDNYFNNLNKNALNMDTVVKIMTSYIDTQSWETAINEHLPKRIVNK